MDNEWYMLDPSPVGAQFPNLESADDAAQKLAENASDGVVAIVHYTATTVRRYRRTVTVVAEDVTPLP